MRAASAAFRGDRPPLLEKKSALQRALLRTPLTPPATALQGGRCFPRDGSARDPGARRSTVALPPAQALTAAGLSQELRRRGVAFVVAPFEADAQMAHMALSGAVAAVVTEDSDLIAYGVPRVFLKMDKNGAGFEVAAAELPRCREMALGGLSGEQFTQLCVLAGCDFAPSVAGVGPRKAAQLLRRFRTAAAAVRHMRFEGAPVPRDYERTLQDAIWTFAHQFVFDSELRRCVHRTPLAPGGLPPERVHEVLGVPPPPEEAQAIAEGTMDPFTRQPFPVRYLEALHGIVRAHDVLTHLSCSLRCSLRWLARPCAPRRCFRPCSSGASASLISSRRRRAKAQALLCTA